MKRGYYDSKTDLYFWSYQKVRQKIKERWLTKDQFGEYKLKSKKQNKERSEYRRLYYLKKREEERLKNPPKPKNKDYELTEYHSLYLLFKNSRCRASNKNFLKRKLVHDLTMQDMVDILKRQNHKCYYSGIHLTTKDSFTPTRVSIERLDSKVGYIKDNVVLCCQMLNYAKNRYTIEEFKEFFKRLDASKEFKQFINK